MDAMCYSSWHAAAPCLHVPSSCSLPARKHSSWDSPHSSPGPSLAPLVPLSACSLDHPCRHSSCYLSLDDRLHISGLDLHTARTKRARERLPTFTLNLIFPSRTSAITTPTSWCVVPVFSPKQRRLAHIESVIVVSQAFLPLQPHQLGTAPPHSSTLLRTSSTDIVTRSW